MAMAVPITYNASQRNAPEPSHLIHQLDVRPHKLLQRVISLLDRLRKRIRRQIRALRTSMRVILRIKRIRRPIPKLRIHLRHRRKMIQMPRALANRLRHQRRILNEPRRSIRVYAVLPLVVRRLTAHNHPRARSDVRFRGVGDVFVERVHDFAGFARGADFVGGAGTVAAAVVGGGVGRAAVVVAEFDYDDVVGLEQGGDFGEAAFVRVAAG
jgi:hypothetical protein